MLSRPALDPLLDHTTALAASFRAASPFPYLVIESFFGAELASRLVEEFPPFDRGNNLDENRRRGRKAVVERLGDLGSAFRAVDELVRSEAFLAWLGEVTGIEGLLFDPDYVGGGTHENLNGQSLDFHIDFSRHPRGWQRRLNLLVYLNPGWSEQWGGCLELRQDPRQPGTRIAPLHNRAVLFETSERSWHGFDEVRAPPDVSRRSLAFYFYTDGSPVQRVHSTVYIDAPLPAGSAALGELRHHLQRRQLHLERLVAEEKRLLEVLDQCMGQTLELGLRSLDAQQIEILRQPVEFLERRLAGLYSVEPELNAMIDALTALPRVEVTGALICVGQDGLFIDSWVGTRLTIRLDAKEPVEQITLCGWCPPEVRGQVLRVGEHRLALVPDENFRWSLPFAAALTIDAEVGWVPSRTSANPDTRELAFVLHRVEAGP